MNRALYYNYIEGRLNSLAYSIEQRGKLNILDYNLHSENFYIHFFNNLFGWNLINLNSVQQNIEALDLMDEDNKIVIQVSSTATKEKVESALTKDSLSNYTGYFFKFISISKSANKLRNQTFKNPHSLNFDPINDIYDIASILNIVLAEKIERQKLLFDFIKKELGSETDIALLETNLAVLINILEKEDLSESGFISQPLPFKIDEKININNLISTKLIIDDYKIYHHKIDGIYKEFDKQGKNKSKSVLDAIRKDYVLHMKDYQNDDLFFKVINCVVERIKRSVNYTPIACEELELAVNILVVDAFIRCRIFENPEGYLNAAS